jgi:hypothetical protein
MEAEIDTRGCVPIENKQKLSHKTPPEGCHALCLPNPSRCCYLGGVSSRKTSTLLNTIARCHAWIPFKYVYLMGPSGCLEAMRTGEYADIDELTTLDHFPTLDYWAGRPGRSALIIDDLDWNLSRRGSPSQAQLADRTIGHVSSHHPEGLSVFIAQQTHTGVPPNIRRLCSHWFLMCNRISSDSVNAIARSCMIERATMRKLFDFCTDQPHDWMLIENIPVEHRSRARKNGWQNVKGLL